MKRIALALIITLVASTAFAEGPILSSADRLAQQVTDRSKMERQNPEMYYAGLSVLGLGAFMIGWGLGEQTSVTCGGGAFLVSCTETGGNKGLFIGTGAALAGGGALLAALGGKKIPVKASLHGITFEKNFSF
jgi:hypothetical protein